MNRTGTDLGPGVRHSVKVGVTRPIRTATWAFLRNVAMGSGCSCHDPVAWGPSPFHGAAMKLRIPAIFAACCLLASAALAQTAPDRHFPAHRLEPAIDAEGMGNTEWAGIPDHLAWDAALLFGYENDPLYSYTTQNGLNPLERSGVLVENRLHANLIGAISLFEWVELGVELPVVLFQNRDTGRVAAMTAATSLFSAWATCAWCQRLAFCVKRAAIPSTSRCCCR